MCDLATLEPSEYRLQKDLSQLLQRPYLKVVSWCLFTHRNLCARAHVHVRANVHPRIIVLQRRRAPLHTKVERKRQGAVDLTRVHQHPQVLVVSGSTSVYKLLKIFLLQLTETYRSRGGRASAASTEHVCKSAHRGSVPCIHLQNGTFPGNRRRLTFTSSC